MPKARFTDRQAKLDVQLTDIDLALAEPYLRQLLRPQVSARAERHGRARLGARRCTAPGRRRLSTLRVDDFRLADAARQARAPALVQLARLELTDLQADLLQRRIGIGTLSLQQPFIDLARDADGSAQRQPLAGG